MERANKLRWSDLVEDRPLDRVLRRRVVGSQAMISRFELLEGCLVPPHRHENEQFSCVLSGRVEFLLEADGVEYTEVAEAGEVMHFAPFVAHGARALVDSVVLDVFAPPSATTGVDAATGARAGAGAGAAAERAGPSWRIAVEDPATADVVALLERHLAFARAHSPPQDVHALDVERLRVPSITFLTLREGGKLLAVGALKDLGGRHAEIKSMHTAEASRGRGVGRTMLDHLLDLARRRGHERVSLETGSMEAFAPARAMYARAGFLPCEPFADYPHSRNSVCMTRRL